MTINHEINILLSQLRLICLILKPFSEGKKCRGLCYGFRVSSQSPVLLPRTPTLPPTFPSWVSSFETFVQGRRKGSLIKADLINQAPDLTSVSDRTKDMKRGSSLGKEERSHCLLVMYRMRTWPIQTFLYLDAEDKPLYLKTTNTCK